MDHRRYLYHARINSHLSLQQIGIRTALSPSVLRNLDEGRFELLPSGVYARSYVRTFAAAVGLNPETALAELEHLLPGAPDPLPALNAQRQSAELPFQLALQLMVVVAGHLKTCKDSIASRTAVPRLPRLPENLTTRTALLFARAGRARIDERIRESVTRLQDWPGVTRFGAAAIDALLLMIVDAFLVCLISWSSGIPMKLLLRDAGWALGAFCAIPIALYFLLFGGIAGSTLGGYICSLMPSLGPATSGEHDHHHPLTLPDILRRAVRR